MTTVSLRVPRRDTQAVKSLGARWDPAEGHWYAPVDRDQHVFAAWLPPQVPHDGAPVPADIILMPEVCYRCQHRTEPVVGLTFPRAALGDGAEYLMEETNDGWFLRYDEISADIIALVCPDDLLRATGAGPLRWRTTRIAPDGYLANTCRHCGTVLGNFPLVEALTEYETEGGELSELPQIDTTVPLGALDWLQARYDSEFEE